MKRVLVLFLALLFGVGVFADEKKTVQNEGGLDEKTQLEFDYSFMEGVRCKITGDIQSAIGWFDNCLKMDPTSPVVKYELANILLLTEDYTGALQLIRDAVAGNPDNLWYKLSLATVLQKKAMIEEACNVYADIIAKYPDNEDYYLIEAGLYTSVEKWQKAIEVYDRYEKQNGISEPATIEKIKLYTKLDDVKGASNELIKLIKKYPEKNEYLSLLADLYFNYNQDKKGLQVVNKLLAADPENGFVHLYIADYFRDKNKLGDADNHVRKALLCDKLDNAFKVQYILRLVLGEDSLRVTEKQLDEYMQLLVDRYHDDLSVRALHSDFLKKDKKYDEARGELEYILAQEKDNYAIWQELLMLCSETMDTACMYEKGKEAMKYFPDEPAPYYFAGISLLLWKRYGEAIPVLKEGVGLVGDNPSLKAQFYSFLGDSYHNIDSVREAFQMFDSVLLINPNDAMVLNNYAYYLSLMGEQLSKAERMSSQAVTLEPENGTYLDTYAWVFFMRKDYSQALYYMKLAIQYSKDVTATLYEHYGDILFKNGDKEKALEMWKKAAEIGDDASEDLPAKIAGEYQFE